MNPEIISSNQTGKPIPAVETNQNVFRINLGDPSEYYLIENRENIGFDQNLPGWGILIWHIDEDAITLGRINNLEWYPPDQVDYGHFTVALEQADGLYQLDKGISSGDPGDPFINGASFTPITNPSSCDYEGRNWNIQITNTSAPGSTMYADFNFSLNYRTITWWPQDTGPQSVLLKGSANPGGQSTQAWFEWGTSTSYGNTTTPVSLGASTTPTTFSFHLKTGLDRERTYHFRAVCQNSSGTFYGEDLEFKTYSNYEWTDMNAENPPQARYGHGLVYDSAHQKVIMFGGWDFFGNRLNDTWAYDYGTNTWTNLNPANPPSGRAGHTLAYDSAHQKVIMFGGFDVYGHTLNDTWAYDYGTNTWTNLNPSNPPWPRCGHAMVYCPGINKVIMFGGNCGEWLKDTWAYDYGTNTWTNLNPANPPPGLAEHEMVYDSARKKVIMFGGNGHGETWAYDYENNIWQGLKINPSPPGTHGYAMTYIQASDQILLFGGWGEGSVLDNNKVWALTFRPSTSYWQNQLPGIIPFSRESHAMVYDSAHQKVIMFGGWYSDTWAYDYGTNTWANLNPANPPPGRYEHAMAFDSVHQKVIMFGGWDPYGNLLNDT